MLEQFPLVTVVVPTHNRPDFLKKTLQSILEQTYSNLEIIVISNGRNDKNKGVVDSLCDARLIYVDQDNSGGPASPRNHGIRLTKGQYVAFCDDDDLWMPNKLDLQISALENNLDHAVCFSKMVRFDSEGEWTVASEEGSLDFDSLLVNNTAPISSVVVRVDLFSQIGVFSESHLVGPAEDYEFLLRAASVTKFYFIDEYLIRYWSGQNRTTQTKPSVIASLKHFRDIIRCYRLAWQKTRYPLRKLFIPILKLFITVTKQSLYAVYSSLQKP